MPRKELIFFSTIVLLGSLDWLTTVLGMVFFGASEANPLLGGLTKTSLVFFSVIKLSAVVLTGLAFYKAVVTSKVAFENIRWTNNFVNGGYLIAFVMLSVVVTSNMAAITGI